MALGTPVTVTIAEGTPGGTWSGSDPARILTYAGVAIPEFTKAHRMAVLSVCLQPLQTNNAGFSGATINGVAMTPQTAQTGATNGYTRFFTLADFPHNGSYDIVLTGVTIALPSTGLGVVDLFLFDADGVIVVDAVVPVSGSTVDFTISTPISAAGLVFSQSASTANSLAASPFPDGTVANAFDGGPSCFISGYSLPLSATTVDQDHDYTDAGAATYHGCGISFIETGVNVPPTVALNTPANGATVTTTTPILTGTPTDDDGDACTVEIEIIEAGSPNGFTGGTQVTASQTSGAGTTIHTNPTGALTPGGKNQVDDRVGQPFQGLGAILDSMDFSFGAYESNPALTNGAYQLNIYLAAGYPITAVPAAWAATTAYSPGDVVRPTSTANANVHFVYRCTVGGTSGGGEPVWPGNGVDWKTVPEGTLVPGDGTVTWEALPGLYPVNPADPADTPTPSPIAQGPLTAYNPGVVDSGFKTITLVGANRIRTTAGQWYIGIVDWQPNDTNINNGITMVTADLGAATAPGSVYIDGASDSNNGPRVIGKAHFRVRETFTPIVAVSDTDPGFGPGSDPFPSGDPVTFQPPSALANGTEYQWRERAKDGLGSGTFGDYTSTRTFTVNTGGGGGGQIPAAAVFRSRYILNGEYGWS